MVEGKKAPEIRFDGYNTIWDYQLLGELCLIGDIDHWMPNSVEYGIPYIMTGDFVGINELDFKNAKKVSLEDYKRLSRKIKPENGDILFARYASIGTVRLVETRQKFLVSYSCAIIKASKRIESEYLYFYFQSETTQRQMQLAINMGSQGNIGIDSLKKVSIQMPENQEQTAIGSFFRSLDDAIALKKQQHEKTVNIKKAMLEKMFPKKGADVPEIRFEGFTEPWKQTPLGDIAEFNPKMLLPNTFRYVDLESVVGTSLVSFRTENKETAPSRAQRLARRGDIFFQTVRPYQRNNLLYDLPFDDFVFSTGYAQLRPRINSYFLLSRLQEDRFVAEVLDYCTGTSYPAITPANLAIIKIIISTDPKEQTAIGNFFRNLDVLIQAQRQELKKLQNIKKACLNKMFI